MSLLTKLERQFGKYAIANLTQYLIAGQVILFLLMYFHPNTENSFPLQGIAILNGQWWRILTFLFIPLSPSPVFAVLTWYLFYLFGGALEREWGDFRYSVYLLIITGLSVICAFLFPEMVLSNGYIFTSVFLAFAFLYPDYTLYLFFILPVKVKWLAILVWLGLGLAFITGSVATKILIGVSIGNFLLFFGRDLVERLLTNVKGASLSAKNSIDNQKTYMKCTVCGKTEKDRKIFYYCHKCDPAACYCEDHLHTHSHIHLRA
jgi:Zn finger protein HypA/HybF involved in hydrogenase expression